MEQFTKLEAAARRQHEEADLPYTILQEILEITASRARFGARPETVEELIRQVEAYDSYAGAGCFGDSVSAGTIESTIRLIKNG